MRPAWLRLTELNDGGRTSYLGSRASLALSSRDFWRAELGPYGSPAMVSAVDPLTRLALQARAGDADALGAFVETGYEQVWRLCATLVGRPGSRRRLAGDLRPCRPLPAAIPRRVLGPNVAPGHCASRLSRRAPGRARRRRRDTALENSEEPSDADASANATVSDLIGRLDPDRRAAFVLTQVLGLSYDEAARVCECPPGTIRSRVARARADLVGFLSRPERDSRQGRSSSA